MKIVMIVMPELTPNHNYCEKLKADLLGFGGYHTFGRHQGTHCDLRILNRSSNRRNAFFSPVRAAGDF